MRNYKPRMRTRAIYLALGIAAGVGAVTLEPAKMFVKNYYGHSFIKQSEIVDTAYDCEIGVFGAAPWRKRGPQFDTKDIARYQEAFRLFGLDEESQKIAMQRVMMQTIDSHVFIGNTNIKGEGQFYGAFYSTTYRKDGKSVVCHNARTNFRTEGYREQARLFVIQSPTTGEIYYLAEPLACNNISRIYPQISPANRANAYGSDVLGSARRNALLLPPNHNGQSLSPNIQPTPSNPQFPYAPIPPISSGSGNIPAVVNNVPEPPAIALSLVGIIAAIYVSRRKKK